MYLKCQMYFISFLLFFSTGFARDDLNSVSETRQHQKSHKLKRLHVERVRKLSRMSEAPAEMEYFKQNLLFPMLRTRVPGTEGNLFVQQHIKNYMSSLGWRIDEDLFEEDTPQGIKSFNNIIATQDVSKPRKLVLACHFDSKYFDRFEFIGATDSAVPCAMMLDLARLMNSTLWDASSKTAQGKDVSLQFIFFDGEEAFNQWTARDSIYGARHLAEQMEKTPVTVGRELQVPQIETIDVMVLLDLIGAPDPIFSNWFPETEKLFERLQKIEKILMKESLLEPASTFSSRKSNKYFVGGLQRYSGIEDDHIPFLRRGVPIVHLIAHPFPKVWHNEGDNERVLDYPTINNLNKILRVFVAEYLHLSP